jgi:hypothetical protein
MRFAFQFRPCTHRNRSLDELGRLYQETGRYTLAESFLKEAMLVTERDFGPQHPQMVTNIKESGGLLNRFYFVLCSSQKYLLDLSIRKRLRHSLRLASCTIGKASWLNPSGFYVARSI